MWLLKRWAYALKVCDEDIVFFNTVANLYKLPRPMLFPTTSMILVSTKKIKIYFFFFFYFKWKASLCFRFPQTKIRICFIFILFFWPGPWFQFPQTEINKYIYIYIYNFKSKPSHKLIWLSLTLFLEKSVISLVPLKRNLLMLLRSWLGRV